jgi:transposase
MNWMRTDCSFGSHNLVDGKRPVVALTKRHVLTDTNGLLVAAVVHQADIQDRDGAPLVLATVRHLHPWLRLFADGAYSGTKLDTALDKIGQWTIEIVKRSDTARGFVVLPRRWVVERTLAWPIAIDASLKTLKPASKVPLHGCSLPASSYSCDVLAG